MNITEIPFANIRLSDKAQDLRNYVGLGWTRPIQFPTAVRLFDKPVTVCNLNSTYGALRFSEGDDGHYEYKAEDRSLPTGMDDFEFGYTLVPWGELVRLAGCGHNLKMEQVNGVIVIDFKISEKVNPKNKYMFQVQFPLAQPNIIEVHYYHALSGYSTFVGCVADTSDFVDWPIKPEQPYMKKALRFDTSKTDFVVEPEPVVDPVVPDDKHWNILWTDNNMELRQRV